MSERYKILDQNRPYFVTFATEGWVDVFTRPIYRDIIIESLKYCQKEKGLVIYAWCLMTNHLHLIIATKGLEKMEDIIRDFKKYTAVHLCRAIESNEQESRKEWMLRIFQTAASGTGKHINYKFWQNAYHPIELFSNEVLDQKVNYIHANPVKEYIVENPEDYIYSSAKDYAGRKGLLDIEFAD
jgi:REP element-mobilizing transposase RayT